MTYTWFNTALASVFVDPFSIPSKSWFASLLSAFLNPTPSTVLTQSAVAGTKWFVWKNSQEAIFFGINGQYLDLNNVTHRYVLNKIITDGDLVTIEQFEARDTLPTDKIDPCHCVISNVMLMIVFFMLVYFERTEYNKLKSGLPNYHYAALGAIATIIVVIMLTTDTDDINGFTIIPALVLFGVLSAHYGRNTSTYRPYGGAFNTTSRRLSII